MKNMNPKMKKWLAVAGGLALCVILVVLIGQRFQTPNPVDAPLPSQSSEVSDVTVDPSGPDSTEKEKEVTVTPPDTTQPVSTDAEWMRLVRTSSGAGTPAAIERMSDMLVPVWPSSRRASLSRA